MAVRFQDEKKFFRKAALFFCAIPFIPSYSKLHLHAANLSKKNYKYSLNSSNKYCMLGSEKTEFEQRSFTSSATQRCTFNEA